MTNTVTVLAESTGFSAVNTIWVLLGAALVFFMQAGFAMVEAGFTRAKNAENIIMKNLMDFCLGTVAFLIVGYSFLCGSDVANGFIGWVGFENGPLTNFASTDWSSFVFNLVFCATAATIVSGAMAERTKFLSYCIYSFVVNLWRKNHTLACGMKATFYLINT